MGIHDRNSPNHGCCRVCPRLRRIPGLVRNVDSNFAINFQEVLGGNNQPGKPILRILVSM